MTYLLHPLNPDDIPLCQNSASRSPAVASSWTTGHRHRPFLIHLRGIDNQHLNSINQSLPHHMNHPMKYCQKKNHWSLHQWTTT